MENRPHLDGVERGKRILRGNLQGPVLPLTVQEEAARDELLGLEVGTVGHGRDAVAHPHCPGRPLVAKTVGAQQLTRLDMAPVEASTSAIACAATSGERTARGPRSHR